MPRIENNLITSRELLLQFGLVRSVSTIIRRTVLQHIGGFAKLTDYPAVDLPTWLRLSKVGPFRMHGEVLGMRREHRSQVTSAFPFSIFNYQVRRRFLQELNIDKAEDIQLTDHDLYMAHRRTSQITTGALHELLHHNPTGKKRETLFEAFLCMGNHFARQKQ